MTKETKEITCEDWKGSDDRSELVYFDEFGNLWSAILVKTSKNPRYNGYRWFKNGVEQAARKCNRGMTLRRVTDGVNRRLAELRGEIVYLDEFFSL
jgi:S-adenosylmethionine hydrolase